MASLESYGVDEYGNSNGVNVPDWRGLAQRHCLPPGIKVPETKLYVTYHSHTE